MPDDATEFNGTPTWSYCSTRSAAAPFSGASRDVRQRIEVGQVAAVPCEASDATWLSAQTPSPLLRTCSAARLCSGRIWLSRRPAPSNHVGEYAISSVFCAGHLPARTQAETSS